MILILVAATSWFASLENKTELEKRRAWIEAVQRYIAEEDQFNRKDLALIYESNPDLKQPSLPKRLKTIPNLWPEEKTN